MLSFIHAVWKLSSTITVWSAGQWAAPVEQLGLGVLLKGTRAVVIRDGQVLLFHFSYTDLSCRSRGLNRQTSGHKLDSHLTAAGIFSHLYWYIFYFSSACLHRKYFIIGEYFTSQTLYMQFSCFDHDLSLVLTKQFYLSYMKPHCSW